MNKSNLSKKRNRGESEEEVNVSDIESVSSHEKSSKKKTKKTKLEESEDMIVGKDEITLVVLFIFLIIS